MYIPAYPLLFDGDGERFRLEPPLPLDMVIGNYTTICKNALKEMFRQTDLLKTAYNDVAQRGLIMRYLILPGNIAGTYELLKFVINEI